VIPSVILLLGFSATCASERSAQGEDEPLIRDDVSRVIEIDPLSGHSLLISQVASGQEIGRATGFVIERGSRQYLITNWHVVTGRSSQTGRIRRSDKRVPDQLAVHFHGPELGKIWIRRPLPLYDGSKTPLWIEHKRGREVDVVAVPLSNVSGLSIYPFPIETADAEVDVGMAAPVTIIGFPEGLAGPRMFPIWKTGHVASELALDYRGAPRSLIDATARPGMSGSPVVHRAWLQRKGKSLALSTRSGVTRFLGIYSGRIGRDTDVGVVWRPSVIDEILSNETK
jgi:hypothetical protein